MRRVTLLLAFVLVAAACGSGDADDTTTTVTTAPPQTATSPTTTTTAPASTTTTTAAVTTTVAGTTTTAQTASGPDLQISSVTFGAGQSVTITNVGDASINLAGFWLCQLPAYEGLPPVELGPGESVSINLGGDVFIPAPGAKTIDRPVNIGSIVAGGGEIALYSSSNFGSSDDIVSYVEWGSAGHGCSSVAIEAGIWGDGDFVATTDDTSLIQVTGVFGSASGWESF